ncbi:MAG: hypothetical protein U0271_30700 [Polyangiaceae bacterium]
MNTAFVLGGLGGLLWLGGFITTFVLALKSKRLPTWGIVLGITTFWCGCGTLAFYGLAWQAFQKGIFADVEAGMDPVEARASFGRFKLAVAISVVGLVLVFIASRMMEPSAPREY